jgi:hypothetical protein
MDESPLWELFGSLSPVTWALIALTDLVIIAALLRMALSRRHAREEAQALSSRPPTSPTKPRTRATRSRARRTGERATALQTVSAPPEPKGGWSAVGPLAFVFLAGALLLGFFERKAIVESWPQTEAFYQAVDLPVSIESLQPRVADMVLVWDTVNGASTLRLSGLIENPAFVAREVPPLRVVLLNERRDPLREIKVQPPVATLAPRDTARFNYTVGQPLPTAVEVELRLDGLPFRGWQLPIHPPGPRPPDASARPEGGGRPFFDKSGKGRR